MALPTSDPSPSPAYKGASLSREHRLPVYSNVDKPRHSVSMEVALERLQAIGVAIEDSDGRTIRKAIDQPRYTRAGFCEPIQHRGPGVGRHRRHDGRRAISSSAEHGVRLGLMALRWNRQDRQDTLEGLLRQEVRRPRVAARRSLDRQFYDPVWLLS